MRLLAEGWKAGGSRRRRRSRVFQFIVQECRRLSSLIENVLDFSRIEQGRKQYEFEPTDAVALVRHTVELMKPYACERSVQLDHVFNDPQPSTLNSQPFLDGRAIQQALVNLIDNAIKHSPKGSIVSVGLELPPAPDHESRITDHGSRIKSSNPIRHFPLHGCNSG